MIRPTSWQWRTFGLFFSVAFVLRLAVALATGYFFRLRTTEMVLIAQNVVLRGEYANPWGFVSGPTAHSTPPFPLFLAVLLRLFGVGSAGQAMIATVTCAASALRCGLTPLFVEDAGLGRGPAIIAGVLSVLYIGALQTEVTGSVDGPFVALALLSIIWMSMRIWRSESWKKRVPLGYFVLCAFSVLLNPQVLPVIACLLAVGFYACGTAFRKRIFGLAVWLGGCVFLVLLPWGIRNWITFDSLILTRSDLGLELWLSNGPGRTYDMPTNYGNLDPLSSPIEARKVIELGEVTYNESKMEEAITWIAANPGAFARLSIRRFAAWWFPPGGIAVSTAKGVLTLLSFAGLWLTWRSQRLPAVLFLWTFLAFPVVFYFIQWSSRYRYPMDWEILVCAAVAIGWLRRGATSGSDSKNVVNVGQSGASVCP